jgi:hypothetical protein
MKANLGHQADQSVLAQLNKSSNPFEDEEYNWSYKRLYYPTDWDEPNEGYNMRKHLNKTPWGMHQSKPESEQQWNSGCNRLYCQPPQLTDKRTRSQHSTATKGGKADSINRPTRNNEILEEPKTSTK